MASATSATPCSTSISLTISPWSSGRPAPPHTPVSCCDRSIVTTAVLVPTSGPVDGAVSGAGCKATCSGVGGRLVLSAVEGRPASGGFLVLSAVAGRPTEPGVDGRLRWARPTEPGVDGRLRWARPTEPGVEGRLRAKPAWEATTAAGLSGRVHSGTEPESDAAEPGRLPPVSSAPMLPAAMTMAWLSACGVATTCGAALYFASRLALSGGAAAAAGASTPAA